MYLFEDLGIKPKRSCTVNLKQVCKVKVPASLAFLKSFETVLWQLIGILSYIEEKLKKS